MRYIRKYDFFLQNYNGYDILESSLSIYDIKSKYYPNIPDYYFNKIVNLDDITSDIKNDKLGKYAKWLLNLYKNNDLNLTDSDIINKSINIFDKLIKLNKVAIKDINKYKSIEDLYQLTDKYDGEELLSKSDIKRKSKKSEKIYSDDRYLIIKPLSKKSSIYYGKGTKWCTSSTSSENKFEEYSERGELYIIIDKGVRNKLNDYPKYLLHFQDGEYKDDENKDINFKLNRNDHLKDIIKKLINIIGISPEELISFCPANIKFIDNPTEELQLKAISKEPYLITYIDNPTDKTKELAIDNGYDVHEIKTKSGEIEKINFHLRNGLITKGEYDIMLRDIEELY